MCEHGTHPTYNMRLFNRYLLVCITRFMVFTFHRVCSFHCPSGSTTVNVKLKMQRRNAFSFFATHKWLLNLGTKITAMTDGPRQLIYYFVGFFLKAILYSGIVAKMSAVNLSQGQHWWKIWDGTWCVLELPIGPRMTCSKSSSLYCKASRKPICGWKLKAKHWENKEKSRNREVRHRIQAALGLNVLVIIIDLYRQSRWNRFVVLLQFGGHTQEVCTVSDSSQSKSNRPFCTCSIKRKITRATNVINVKTTSSSYRKVIITFANSKRRETNGDTCLT